MVVRGVLGGEGGLGGGLEGERGPHLPLVGDGVEGAACSTAPQWINFDRVELEM